MQMKILFATLAALTMLTLPAGANDLGLPRGNDAPDVDFCAIHDVQELAESDGVFTETFPTATPGLTVTVHMLCYGEIAEDVLAATDCTATAWSHTGWKWNTAYSGVLDTTNPYGLSASGLLNAFNAGGNEWDNVVGADIFGSISAG